MSLYAEYLKEVYDKNVIESDDFLVIYSTKDQVLYLEDLYIKPDKRDQGLGQQVLNSIMQIAKENFCKTLLTSVTMNCKYKDENLSKYLHVGFQISNFCESIVYLKKDL